MEDICNSTVYTRKSKDYLLRLRNLILWKSYSEKENTWEFALAVQQIYKLINIFYKNYIKKLITILL